MRMRVSAHALGTAVAAIALVGGALQMASTGDPAHGDARAGSSALSRGQGIGDPYYPADGNRGYDVARYHVRLAYWRPMQRIVATTTIAARATARLDRLNLDLVGLNVESVRVNGRAATFRRAAAHELVITPRQQITQGSLFQVQVSYRGRPGNTPRNGWHDATTPGAGFILGEPHSCTAWYPCNDHPTDKAAFALTATVPRPLAVVSIGRQLPTTSGRRPDGTPVRTYRWRLREATTTYLTTMYIDKLTFERSRLPNGIPVVTAYGPRSKAASTRQARLPAIVRVLSNRWGPYPAPAAGGIFVSGRLGFSLETFTRPVYAPGVGIPTIVHENAHQWWGDNISIHRWRDICLSECFASYSEQLWAEHHGALLDRRYRQAVRGEPRWLRVPIYDMGPGREFTYAGVYLKGAYFVHALRNKVGDVAFFRAMRALQQRRAGDNMSMGGLREALERSTGVDLTSFWSDWVLHARVPSRANLYPGDL